ncbi:hypothetical protein PRNP1_014192 [Phytophthora ramorum]
MAPSFLYDPKVAQREHKENGSLDPHTAPQWVNADRHETILPRLYSFLKPGGVLTFQIPDARLQPSHQRMVDAAEQLGVADRVAVVRWVTCEKDPSFYYESFKGIDSGVELDMWAAIMHRFSRATTPWLISRRCGRTWKRYLQQSPPSLNERTAR